MRRCVPVLAGLAASAALAVDYLHPPPVFCSEGGGCEAVRQTAFAAPLGVPTPIVGLVGFLGLGVASLLPGRRARIAQVALATGASLVGAVLLAAQVGARPLLPVLLRRRRERDCERVRRVVAAPRRGGRAAASSPGLRRRGMHRGGRAARPSRSAGGSPDARPRSFAPRWRARRAGEVTLVDFVDFECPFCRMTNAALEPILEEHRDRLRVVRRQVPLRMHPHALDAARAACCGERLGKGDAMASALFSAPVESSPAKAARGSRSPSVSRSTRTAPASPIPKTDESIESDRAAFKAAGGYALPTIWIDGNALIGAQPTEALEKAIVDALAHAGG